MYILQYIILNFQKGVIILYAVFVKYALINLGHLISIQSALTNM